jgi:predicted nuclease of predicted toxin-antitoxin system
MMRFLVDECTGPTVAKWLKELGHTVVSVYARLLDKAFKEDFVLVTNDKGFGTLIFQQKLPHRGVILLRLDNESPTNKISVLERVLEQNGEMLRDHFTVASEAIIRIS